MWQKGYLMAAALVCSAAVFACGAGATGIRVQPFGVTRDGKPVDKVILENDRGMRLAYIDYGATLTAAEVADRHGRRRNIVLSLPDLPAYERTQRRFAAVMGRYAGRIAGARYTLDGRTVQLVPNAKGVALHGDPNGYDKRVWQRQDFADAESIGSIYRLHSPGGDQNFPGALDVSVTYRLLRKRDEFRIEYRAATDAPTVLNLTSHAFYNLAGAGSAGLATQRFQIDADRYAVTDGNRIPTGELASVAGTPLDFRRPASMAARLVDAASSPLLAPSGGLPGIDHSLLFSKPPGACARVAGIEDLASGRRMEVSTSEPALQLNSGSGFDGSEMGSEGRGYQRYDGFAFETQHLPDSPNHPGFPGTALYPGQEFRALTSFRFSAGRPAERDRMGSCPRLQHNSMKKNVPTIRDVAAAAGVSTATVSKLVNGTQRFSPAVEATIRKVIADLGYRSNPLAQSMITGRTQSIGLSVLDVANPHFTSIVKGANRVALANGYNLLLVDTEENPSRERPLLEALSRRVDGMIVFSRMLEPDMDWMMDLHKPLVFFGRLSRLEIPWVASDDHRGAYMLARHLVTQGHKHFAYLGFSRSRRDEERLGGIRACLAEHKLEISVHDGSAPSAQEGERMCSSIMLTGGHPDVVICYNDLMALGFMKAARILGFRLPADVSVAGFDNIQYGNYTSPALTTVDLQSERMGVAAMEKLIATIAGQPAPAATMIEPQLILRDSVARRS